MSQNLGGENWKINLESWGEGVYMDVVRVAHGVFFDLIWDLSLERKKVVQVLRHSSYGYTCTTQYAPTHLRSARKLGPSEGAYPWSRAPV